MRLEAAIFGNLHAYMNEQKLAAESAVTNGVAEITNQIKQDLRGQVLASGLKAKLAQTWRSITYPRNQKSLSAAGIVFSKAEKIIAAFEYGTIIKSKHGGFLAIPTKNAPKRGINNKRISPSNFPEMRYGKLRFIYLRGRVSLLVADKQANDKGAIKGKNNTKVMFLLVPQVKMPKKLDIKQVSNKWIRQLPQEILNQWK